jgi:hypothetical protein
VGGVLGMGCELSVIVDEGGECMKRREKSVGGVLGMGCELSVIVNEGGE